MEYRLRPIRIANDGGEAADIKLVSANRDQVDYHPISVERYVRDCGILLKRVLAEAPNSPSVDWNEVERFVKGESTHQSELCAVKLVHSETHHGFSFSISSGVAGIFYITWEEEKPPS